MKTTSLEILEKSKLPPEQSRAILKTMELELTGLDGNIEALKGDVNVLRGEVHALDLKMTEEFGKVRAEMRSMESRLVLWMFGMLVTLAGLSFAFLNHVRP